MKKITLCLGLVVLGLSLAISNVHAADAKTYQVTGPVLEVTPTMIVVKKGEDKWQIASDTATSANIKVGDKVTIQYQMVAKSIEVKPAK